MFLVTDDGRSSADDRPMSERFPAGDPLGEKNVKDIPPMPEGCVKSLIPPMPTDVRPPTGLCDWGITCVDKGNSIYRSYDHIMV